MLNTDALINKYRPREWDNILGQKTLIAALRESVKNRTSRAYLLCGPSGTGKTSVARIIAEKLHCANPLELDAATSNSVEDMRAIIEAIRYKPILEDATLAIIVDECHMLTKAAWNSLLKSIEEPPSWITWCFCTTDPGRVPENIKTRCLHANFNTVSKDDLFELLVLVCSCEEWDTPDDVLDVCIDEAFGSPRMAIANLALCSGTTKAADAAILLRAAGATGETIELVRALAGGADWNAVKPLLQKLGETNAESVRKVANAYVAKAILNARNEQDTLRLFRILECFSEPFNYNDGITPLILAVGRILLTE